MHDSDSGRIFRGDPCRIRASVGASPGLALGLSARFRKGVVLKTAGFLARNQVAALRREARVPI